MKKIMLAAIACCLAPPVVHAQEITAGQVAQILDWESDAALRDLVAEQFAGFRGPDLAFGRLSSIVAIPGAAADQLGIDDLAEGELIGALYVGSGSSRLDLPPGPYLVGVRQGEGGNWQVDFVDDVNDIRGSVGARVVSTEEPVLVGLTAVDHSVCYRADSWEVCF